MIQGKKVIVVMPAYNAEKTLRNTFSEIPFDIVDEVILVDDASNDNTLQ
jgi:glycosyltransferase involved in cell wall biosynthesis